MRITICGNFGKDDERLVNGQITKTRNLFNLLNRRKDKIYKIDTSRNKFIVFFKLVLFYFLSKTFVLVVSRNGFKRLGNFLRILKKFKKTKTVYMCVGTCPLPSNYVPGNGLDDKTYKLRKILSAFDLVCAETEVLKEEIEKMFSVHNCCVFKNYQLNKKIVDDVKNFRNILNANKKHVNLVFLSRICMEKNVLAIFASLDSNGGLSDKIAIDFYGPIQDDIKGKFLDEISKRRNCTYKGVVENDKVPTVLSRYDFMLFTTLCLEGTPGAIIDASFAGLPILTQKFWASEELVSKPRTGYVFEDIQDLLFKSFSVSKDEYCEMVENCIKFATTYTDSEATFRFNEILSIRK